MIHSSIHQFLLQWHSSLFPSPADGPDDDEADLESEASSVNHVNKRRKDLSLVSPLEYSAMLKLYAQDFKDVTPDSGMSRDMRSRSLSL